MNPPLSRRRLESPWPASSAAVDVQPSSGLPPAIDANPHFRCQFAGENGVLSEGYSIEVADELVGIVVRGADERVFRFHSAVKEYKALDGHRFARPEAAERAAREHSAHRRLGSA
jgi:hypothetical protein